MFLVVDERCMRVGLCVWHATGVTVRDTRGWQGDSTLNAHVPLYNDTDLKGQVTDE